MRSTAWDVFKSACCHPQVRSKCLAVFRGGPAYVVCRWCERGDDVITWSIQTMNSATLPDLCGIVDELAQLSQDRVN